MQTLSEALASSPFFDENAVAQLSSTGNPKFWRQFRRNRDTRFESCVGPTTCDVRSVTEFEDRLRRAIESQPGLSIVEEFYTESAQHYLINWSGLARRIYIGALGAGFVLSITSELRCTSLPFISLAGGGGQRSTRILRYSIAAGFGACYTLFMVVLLLFGITNGSNLEIGKRVLPFAGLSLVVIGMLIPGLIGLRTEYATYRRGLDSPLEADITDVTEIGERLLNELSHGES